MSDPASKPPRRWTTVAARTLLALLLLAQLTILWVVTQPVPTRLPTGMVTTLVELASGRIRVECREATVNQRGRLRLAGVKLYDSLHPEDSITGEVDLLPDWLGLLRGKFALISLQLRGRGSLGETKDASAIDDFVVRLHPGAHALRVQAAARAGSMAIRTELSLEGTPGKAEGGKADLSSLEWNRPLAMDCLRMLRSVQGAVGVEGSNGEIRVDGAFVDNPSATGPLPVAVRSGRLRGAWSGPWHLEIGLSDVTGAGVVVDRVWLGVGDNLRLRVLSDGIRYDGISGATACGEGVWRPGQGAGVWLKAETADSRISAELDLAPDSLHLREAFARITATDLAKVSPLAKGAREMGVDLVGCLEFLGGEVLWQRGQLALAGATFAVGETGWRDLRPRLFRPEREHPRFVGDISYDPARGRLNLSNLDLAGIRGEIDSGTKPGDMFVVRLASTEGNPINPGCLNSLLGEWWVKLWSNFDLSTHDVRPDADARVEGRLGDPKSLRVAVKARLSRFGYMGARFLEANLWAFSSAEESLVRIDNLRGEVEGKAAGDARITLRWDWRHPEWQAQPQITAEGWLMPACVIRFYDPALASSMAELDFANPRIQASLGPGQPLRVSLETQGVSTLYKVKVGDLKATLTRPPGEGQNLVLEANAELSGCKANLRLAGDFKHTNQVRLLAKDWSKSGVTTLIGQVTGKGAAKDDKDLSKLDIAYEGSCDFLAPLTTEGRGHITFTDPHLKTIRIFGPVSAGLELIGLNFSSYQLNRADIDFQCANGKAEVNPLNVTGEDASLKFKGFIDLQKLTLDLKGQLNLKKSSYRIVNYLNPNRLIASIVGISVSGPIQDPKVSAELGSGE